MERIYLDTSVFGGYFDPEFELWSKLLFDKIIKGDYILLYSQLTEIELNKAPEHVKELVKQIPEKYIEYVAITTQAYAVADQYVKENVVGKSSIEDCRHIALATLNNADILVSWNFKHIVNVNRIRGYNSINYRLGHKILEIRTPREILYYED
jgi:predicted nucleic acid-binding protein